MNYRYLFRAKRKNWKQLPKEMWWVEGYYAYFKGNDNHCIYYETYGFTLVCDIDISTLCACTGFKDKNGKLIWENDIVKHDFGEDQIGVQLAIVKYDSKYACYQIKPIYDWMYCDKSDCEVIGNIFDNPELLEVGE